jgi:hypothetical protein
MAKMTSPFSPTKLSALQAALVARPASSGRSDSRDSFSADASGKITSSEQGRNIFTGHSRAQGTCVAQGRIRSDRDETDCVRQASSLDRSITHQHAF